MLASSFSTSKYASASDFGPEPTVWIIHAVGSAVFKRNDDQEERATVTLADPEGRVTKPMVLNVTRLRALSRVFGDDMDRWLGRTVRVWTEVIFFRGEETQTIRIASAPAAVQEPRRTQRRAVSGAAPDLRGPNDEIPF
jgi:hypothetical protein